MVKRPSRVFPLALLAALGCQSPHPIARHAPTAPLTLAAASPPPEPAASVRAAPEPPAEPPPPPYQGPHSAPLRNAALRSPMPGGFVGGWYGDTGLDIAGNHLDVFAIAAGTLDYSERGHTHWTRGKDTPYSVRIALDEPIAWGNRRITHVFYTHLSKLETEQSEGAKTRKHVEAGERIGVSGIGNGVPHLHLGLLLDGQVEQDSWEFILREGDVRKVFGVANGTKLP